MEPAKDHPFQDERMLRLKTSCRSAVWRIMTLTLGQLDGGSPGKIYRQPLQPVFFLRKPGVSYRFSNQLVTSPLHFIATWSQVVRCDCSDSVSTKAIVRDNNHYSSQDKLTRSDPYYMRPRQGALGSWRRGKRPGLLLSFYLHLLAMVSI